MTSEPTPAQRLVGDIAPKLAELTDEARWTAKDVQTVGAAEELQISSRRPDGTLRPYVTIWVVRSDDEIYVRSAHGTQNPWYQRALTSGTGRIRAAWVESDVQITRATDADDAAIDSAYHTKYDRYGPTIVNTVVGPSAAQTNLLLSPLA
jgi:hypothetical protein